MCYRYFVIREGRAWDAYIERVLVCEIYHSWNYHLLNKEGEPLLFVYEEGDVFIALPLIKRKIEGSSSFDLTSVYGYAGPVANTDLLAISAQTAQNFKAAFIEFMKQENCICVFSRLHPFLNQNHLLENLGGVYENGKTIYMNLTLSLEEQRSKYEKRLYRQIRKLRGQGYIIREASGPQEISLFTEMYNENMDRLHASANYYFDEQYFTDLLQNHKFGNKLILIYKGAELICGALILVSKDIVRNHLSATAPEYVKESPSKLLTDEISLIGRRLGTKIFHLGGGVGGREDSLFKFKSYFSTLHADDRIWCYISEEDSYNELVKKRGNELIPGSKFFPAYRQPVKKEDQD